MMQCDASQISFRLITAYPQVETRFVQNVTTTDEPGLALQDGTKYAYRPEGRGLFATRHFNPGDLILEEPPLLHTFHSIAKGYTPTSALPIPRDWQRLLHLYAYLRQNQNNPLAVPGSSPFPIHQALSLLSSAGVTSPLAKEADPERDGEYRDWAQEWVKRWKEKEKESRKKKRKRGSRTNASDPSEETGWLPTVEEIERVLAVLETNVHEREGGMGATRDLLDPRKKEPEATDDVVMRDAEMWDAEDEEEGKDEACGLYLLASMVNHSCLPNATVYIAPSGPLLSHLSRNDTSMVPSPPGTLLLRAIRPIQPGAELFISYHDEEYALNADRRDILRPRGFGCRCVLCKGEVAEYMRGATCPGSCGGVAIPRRRAGFERKDDGEDDDGVWEWKCTHCGRVLAPMEAEAVEEAEEKWIEGWEGILGMVEGMGGEGEWQEKNYWKLLVALTDVVPFSRTRPHSGSTVACTSPRGLFSETTSFPSVQILTHLDSVTAPLSLSHASVYAYLKYVLFERSVWLRSALGDEGVLGVLLGMAVGVERGIGSLGEQGLGASEERRVLGYWMVKEVERLLEARVRAGQEVSWEERKWLEELQQEGWDRWAAGMRILYGYMG